MEEIPSPESTEQEGLLSCWGCLKQKLPWKRSRIITRLYTSISRRHVRSESNTGAAFNYDPLSYAQNFDEGWDEDDQDLTQRGFSARFVAPLSKPLQAQDE